MKDKICNLTQKRTDDFAALFETFDNDDKLYQIQLLRTETEKQKDIILTYKKNLKNLQKRLSRKSSPRGPETNRSSSSSKTKTMKVSQLKEKMDAMTQEQQLIKASYLSIIEGKEQEIEICRKMLKDQGDIHKDSVKELKQHIEKMKTALLNK